MSFDAASILKMTNGCPAVDAAYNAYCQELLGYGANLRALFTTADAHPDCPLINANAAALHLAFEGREGWQDAQPYLQNMRNAVADASERERIFCAAIDAWSRKDFFQTLLLLEDLCERWPEDIVAIKWGQYHAFNLGEQVSLLRLGELAVQAFPDPAIYPRPLCLRAGTEPSFT